MDCLTTIESMCYSKHVAKATLKTVKQVYKKKQMSFDALEAQGSLLEKLTASLDTKSGYIDEKLWKPKLGKGETGSAVIRFLPPSHGNPLPWVNRYQHAFKVNDRWFIEECPTTLEGRKCPVCEATVI